LAIPIVDPGLTARLNERMIAVERKLVETVSVADPLAHDVARHLLSAGGKRIRPFLTLLTGELGDGSRPEVLQAAIAVELTHLASLYHDDVMDSAPLRRGMPSAHMVWGNSVAIIVGDVLFARASGVVAGLGPQAVRIQAETFERLCLGQLHETVGPQPGDDPVEHYLSVLADKTASLVATSARYGAMFSGAPAALVDVVAAYGERVGVAFQLADDVLDLASTGAASGKTPGTDLRDHVPTMPVLLLRQRVAAGTAAGEDRALLAALDADLSSDEALAAVIAALREHPVVDETRALAAHWAHDAADQLAPLPNGPVREALEAFAVSLADRAS
jgi:heptaprenyl diphosphate synthase